jgi:hypothetical protein
MTTMERAPDDEMTAVATCVVRYGERREIEMIELLRGPEGLPKLEQANLVGLANDLTRRS